MELGERHHEGRQQVDSEPSDEGTSAGLDAARAAAARFIRAGDRAIERALSRDSEAFLRSSRQQGGE
jgi:hypothetical protein